ncbi:3-methyl-2-oxobutanoate hydroxymethyltransferase [Aquirufa antheringensis]|jgi:3-methyl-2-oxobutanoate hydroxymethyltransferase|uniref:3-methyl-2-oxobutanoate hydroxymethyltransferase n=1 Tax=Aquirufa antheringensis TaxID=2516559 RepID=A0A4Q9BH99_9BACT|nr:3-methyl-2-oxobutanoate hydroxymethyltransferase [Aquirufa antheringensis]MCZ2484893.1 3-methyl-2-oxobutanoate hydroxymethyltransferase [Aquirufa antheringensis]MCZ2487096.1 3-methyl-2-oxobutanoate hydroxymethyltransferase [Aquirufa antheringensis]MCZ2489923.1 3-methyl-2-oxobutanoate hydroxymethyltransferase [Aquirufa antheringensis]TBH75201.1 3-methyl-2-oxobutanoate hydroxymethyltransferase [Aquirufa antheringensis]
MSYLKEVKRITTTGLQSMKVRGEKIAMLTCYDYTMATLLDAAGTDVLLVGDSASNVMAGHETTLPITLDQMIYHAQCVSRGAKRAMVLVDMPFGSYQSDSAIALASAVRIMKETGAHAVKLEGGEEVLESILKITKAGIPVMGHLGLTPQSIHQFGSYGLQGKGEEAAEKLIKEALMLQEAGCFGLVVEKIPAALAAKVSAALQIPTIGIGAGVNCDGQVLVMQDMLGMNNEFKPKFLRKYADLAEEITRATSAYVQDVKQAQFPSAEESY